MDLFRFRPTEIERVSSQSHFIEDSILFRMLFVPQAPLCSFLVPHSSLGPYTYMTSEVQGGKGGDAPKAGERKKGCVIMTVKRNEGVQNFADVI